MSSVVVSLVATVAYKAGFLRMHRPVSPLVPRVYDH